MIGLQRHFKPQKKCILLLIFLLHGSKIIRHLITASSIKNVTIPTDNNLKKERTILTQTVCPHYLKCSTEHRTILTQTVCPLYLKCSTGQFLRRLACPHYLKRSTEHRTILIQTVCLHYLKCSTEHEGENTLISMIMIMSMLLCTVISGQC